MQYTSGEKRERDNLAEETIRRFKKQKADETKQINEKQRFTNEKRQRKIDDWLECLKTSQEALDPPVTSERLNDMQDLLKAAEEHCDAIEDSGECCLDFREFLNTMAEFERAFNENKAAIDAQVKEAKSLKKWMCQVHFGCAMGA